MDITIVTGVRPEPRGGAIAGMFADRKQLFVDLLGWDVPVVAGAYEIDAFDDEHCVYIVALDAAGRHAGSLRLLPTTRPHILGSLFTGLAEDGVPTGPATCEITRLCLPVRFGAAGRLEIRNRLISAMVDHALEEGIDALTGVVSASFRAQVLAMGWRAHALGPARRIGQSTLAAFAISIEPDTPARLAATGIYAPRAAAAARAA